MRNRPKTHRTKPHRTTAAIALAGCVGLATLVACAAEEEAEEEGEAAAPPRPGLVINDFKPAFDDLMTMLVQPRHIKLYYAGEEENWMLARFQLNEMRAAFTRISETIPDYAIFNVADAFDSTVVPSIEDALDAVNASDKAAFDRAYVELTAACNACHEATHFPFIVITIPEAGANPYVDQDFRSFGG